jgi:molybdopterin-guanine dinucleotide biosynthesis protein A
VPVITPPAEAFLLAGGGGRRLGEDKRFLPFRGRPLYLHQLEKLRTAFGCATLLCKKGERTLFGLWDGAVLEEETPGSALLHGLVSGLEHCASPVGFFLGVDLPLLPVGALEFFREIPDEERIVVARTEGRFHFACARYPRSVLPVLQRYRNRGEYRMTALLAALPHRVLSEEELPFLREEPRALFNVNGPGDLEALRRWEGRRTGN